MMCIHVLYLPPLVVAQSTSSSQTYGCREDQIGRRFLGVTSSDALVTTSVLVTTSKALVTSSVALVTTSKHCYYV